MKFQDKLQQLRKQKLMSQEKLADLIGISRQAVAKWELGHSYPDMLNLIAISDLFRVSIDHLVKDNEDNSCIFKQIMDEIQVDETAIDFLCRAKKATYAGNSSESESSRPKSHDLIYTEGPLAYIDTYLGSEKFAGEEALWLEDTPFWSMNYVGRIVSEGFDGDFLKDALSLVPKEYPYRGPLYYRNGDYSYHCMIQGKFEWFNGYEEIFYGERKVYECMFHGGSII
ncbi:DUF5680 domain-containing protein [Cohnella terricola]|uniref:Helix-turn-helix transcriptional regulator n=1 Tax=Cohnella terricola TaxID=1289167 RepID=A0A559JJ03_9BACL|nr:DUF5680 domain-containing protein [Cohnella terricola]TVX99848.1 helix-turn-helix transcriptional regulator [Cohnella terricola]